MKTVWKYDLTVGANAIAMPQGAELLEVREQHDVPCLWVLCEPDEDEELERRTFVVCGTGHPAPEGQYVGTFFLSGGTFVGHLFETTRR